MVVANAEAIVRLRYLTKKESSEDFGRPWKP